MQNRPDLSSIFSTSGSQCHSDGTIGEFQRVDLQVKVLRTRDDGMLQFVGDLEAFLSYQEPIRQFLVLHSDQVFQHRSGVVILVQQPMQVQRRGELGEI